MFSSGYQRYFHYGSSSSYPPPPVTSSNRYIMENATEILATRDVTDVTGITKLVMNLFYGKESDESSKLLYDSYKEYFPDLLAVKLLRAYRFSTTPSFRSSSARSYSLELLSSLLIECEVHRCKLKPAILNDMRVDLKACLLQQETSYSEFKLLATIASRVSEDFLVRFFSRDELSSFILSLRDKKMLLMFSELPLILDEDFLKQLSANNLEAKIVKVLFDQDSDYEEWCLALVAGFSLMLQLINMGRQNFAWDSVYAIVNSVWQIVNVRKREMVVHQGLRRLVKKMRIEALRFLLPEYEFVSRLLLMIKGLNGVEERTQIAAKISHDLLERCFILGRWY